MGKHKPIWDPSTDCGDYVVATGCTDVYVTGKKMQQKLYYRQTTKPGALKAINMETMMRKWGGGEVLKRAVRGMLPKNRLRDPRLARLKGEFFFGRGGVQAGTCNHGFGLTSMLIVFEGEEHPYKHNLIKFDGRNRVKDLPVTKTATLEAKPV